MRVTRFLPLAGLLFLSCTVSAEPPAARKILFVDSYHEGYVWSDGLTQGIRSVLASQVVTYLSKGRDNGPAGIALKIVRMDTKRNNSEDFKQLAAIRAKAEIESFKPDVVIACDDNAAQYLIAQFYKDAALPFVFCGVNWDASVYGFPYKNVTGMIEVDFVDQVLAYLKRHARGERIGVIGADNETARKTAENQSKVLGIEFARSYFPASFAAWKEDFSRAQEETDILIFLGHAGIKDWDDAQAKDFVENNIRIPTGTVHELEIPYALLSMTKVAQEQGIWAAKTALRILEGTPPSEIPIAANEQSHFLVNLRLAEKLDITFDPGLLNLAEIIR